MSRRMIVVAGALALGVVAAFPVAGPLGPPDTVARWLPPDTVPQAIVRDVCTRCHSDQRPRGNLSLEGFRVEDAVAQAKRSAATLSNKLIAGERPGANVRRETMLGELIDRHLAKMAGCALLVG